MHQITTSYISTSSRCSSANSSNCINRNSIQPIMNTNININQSNLNQRVLRTPAKRDSSGK